MVKLKFKNPNRLNKLKRKFANDHKIRMITNADILAAYKDLVLAKDIKPNKDLEFLLQRRKVRTLSGVAPVTILTKPFPCPGRCVYCPTEPNMPKSYLSNEPAAMRAVMNKFDAYNQVTNRLQALVNNGHHPDKIDLIILGGTWSFYPKGYQEQFFKDVYRAANDFGSKSKSTGTLEELQNMNEQAEYRIIGASVETRPDWVTAEEIKLWRHYGVTRIQIGAQHLDDEIQKLTQRGHLTADLIKATKLIKDAGFKLDYHIMQNLPGSTPKKDLWCVRKIVSHQNFQPDQLKIYPTIVNEHAELKTWFEDGRWKPYTEEQLVDLICRIKETIPYWVRINRIIRDFPSESILAGNIVTNLREVVTKEMAKRKIECRCIRCREAKQQKIDTGDLELFKDDYKASGGREIFLNYASKDRRTLYAFCRLRLPGQKNKKHFLKELQGAAIIRELHTFGTLVPISTKSGGEPQHMGLGKKLMTLAEEEAKKAGFKKVAVISGVGVRGYYKKMGYEQIGTYMIKVLK